jgi:hypothetical protein
MLAHVRRQSFQEKISDFPAALPFIGSSSSPGPKFYVYLLTNRQAFSP